MPQSTSRSESRRGGTRAAGAAAAPSAAGDREIDSELALRIVRELMAIPGGSGDEEAVAQYIADRLRETGLPASAIRFDTAHRRSPIGGKLGNMIVKLPGAAGGPRRLLSAHLDTVPICIGAEPVRRGKVIVSANPKTGLGGDDRAGAAVLLVAALALLAGEHDYPPLTFLWFVQEEVGLQGSHYLNAGMLGKPKLAFNFDGGAPEKLTLGATGGYRMAIDIEGIASHAGGAPEAGVSAIAVAALAIAELHQEGWHGQIRKTDRRGKTFHGTSNVGVIEGGAATNVVADRVLVKAEARSHDRRFRERIVREIQSAFERAARQVRSIDGRRGRVSIEGRLDYESFALSPSDPSVLAAEEAIRAVGGLPTHAISNGGLDANWLTAHGIPTVTLGCGQRNIHTTDEQLDVEQFLGACQIGLRLARG